MSLSGQEILTDSLRNERLKEIQKCVERDRYNAQCWWYGWIGAYSAATAGQGTVYFLTDSKTTKQDMALGSATTFLGVIGQLITPLVPGESSYQYNQVPDSTINGLNKFAYDQEKFLKEIAIREKVGRSWKVHAVTGVVNIGSGLVTWLGFKRSFRDGIENFILNTVITEAQIWTQPVRASKDYKRLFDKYPESASYINKPEKEWSICAYPGGISVRLRF
jgi:hypothetical protein